MGRRYRTAARAVRSWLARRLEDLAVTLVRLAQGGHFRRSPRRGPPAHADERTARRVAEAQRGGLSSGESLRRWVQGENPGGLHHRAVHHEGPEHARPEQLEPQERKERLPRGDNHMAVNRRGS
jgi:hypothetical protein